MKYRIIFFIIILSVFLSGSSYEDILDKQLDSAKESGFEDFVPEETENILKSIGIDNFDYESISEITFSDMVNLILENFYQKIKEPFKAIFTIFSAALACSVIQSFSENFRYTGTIANVVTTLLSASIFLLPIKEIIIYSVKVIEECSNFMLAFIPVYSSAVAASGYVSSATGFHSAMLAAVTIISNISGNIIAPLICIYLSLCIAGSVSDFDIGEIAKTVKNFAVWVLVGLMTVFSGIMGLGTLVSSTVDGNFSKTAKFLIGTAVPVVGSTISDALSTIKGCLSLTKNVLGIYAVIVIAAIFLPPLISLVSWKICLSFSSGLGSILGNKNLSSLLSSVSSVLGILTALVTVTAIMFIFAVSIMLMTGGGT